MNKSSSLFLEQLKKLNLPKDKFAIFGSGPLGIRGIRDSRDLDLIVDELLFNQYKKMPGWEFKSFDRDGYHIEMVENGGIELYKTWGPGTWNLSQLINDADIIDNLPFVRLEEVKKWKNISGREKDLKDIQLINEYLQKTKE